MQMPLTAKARRSPRFVFFGNSRFSLCVLMVLKGRGYLPTAIVTKPGSAVTTWAEENGIQSFASSPGSELIEQLGSQNADVFVVAAFSMLPAAVFDIPKHGTLNIHPSLLPRYRGSAPEQAQIMSETKVSGVTIHLLDNEFDHGPIVAEREVTFKPWPPLAGTMGLELAAAGGELLADVLMDWIEGKITARAQHDADATYTKDIVPRAPLQLSPTEEHQKLFSSFRALGRAPGTYFSFFDTEHTEHRAFIQDAYARNGSFIVTHVSIDDLAVRVPYESFLAKNGFAGDPVWQQFSEQYADAAIPTTDAVGSDPYLRLREAIFKDVIVHSDEAKIVTPRGSVQSDGWLFDFRTILMRSEYMNLIADIFWEKFGDQYPFQVGGQEVAAIPLVCAIALKGEHMGKPVNGFFIRKSKKKTGLQKVVEGALTDEKIILVDDLMNFGATQIRQIELLEAEGRKVHGIFVIMQFRKKVHYVSILERGINVTSVFSPEDFGLHISQPDELPRLKSHFMPLWKFESENPNFFYVVPKSGPVLDNEKIYFGSDSGIFWAVNQTDGTAAWKFKIWRKAADKAIFSTPALHENTVYFGAYDGHVYALDTATGTKRWDFWEADWIGSSPALAPDLNLLFVGLEFGLFKRQGGVAALDMTTGEKRWEHTMPGLTHASPAYSKKFRMVGVGCNDGVFRMFDAKNGTLLWECKTDGDIKSSAVFDETRGYVLFGSFDGHIYMCDARTGEVRGTFVTEGPIYSTPLIEDNTGYVTSLDKRLYAIDLETFGEKWRFDTNGRIFTNPTIVNDHVLIGSNDGFLYELTKEGRMTGFFSAQERVVNNVTFNSETDRYFLWTHANELYCLKKEIRSDEGEA